MRQRIPRNSPCPCGSGKKYKQCCLRKGIEWSEDDEGGIAREVPLSAEASDGLDRLWDLFRQATGREPGPGDRLADVAPPLELMNQYTIDAMQKAGVEPALIHAFRTTGMMLNAKTARLVPDVDVAEWEAAIAEYERATGTKASHRFLTDADFEAIMANGPKI